MMAVPHDQDHGIARRDYARKQRVGGDEITFGRRRRANGTNAQPDRAFQPRHVGVEGTVGAELRRVAAVEDRSASFFRNTPKPDQLTPHRRAWGDHGVRTEVERRHEHPTDEAGKGAHEFVSVEIRPRAPHGCVFTAHHRAKYSDNNANVPLSQHVDDIWITPRDLFDDVKGLHDTAARCSRVPVSVTIDTNYWRARAQIQLINPPSFSSPVNHVPRCGNNLPYKGLARQSRPPCTEALGRSRRGQCPKG